MTGHHSTQPSSKPARRLDAQLEGMGSRSWVSIRPPPSRLGERRAQGAEGRGVDIGPETLTSASSLTTDQTPAHSSWVGITRSGFRGRGESTPTHWGPRFSHE